MKAPTLSFFLALFLAGCAPTVTPAPTPTRQVVSVYASPAAEPWLSEVYTCAEQTSAIIRRSATESDAEIRLRLGEPEHLTTPAYQIGSEEMLIVTHRESPIQNLTIDEAQTLFAQGQENVALWVYASGEDVQEIFAREIMRGMPIHSFARLAANPQQMSDTLNAEKNAVGILPRRWKVGTVRFVFSLPNVPVLALTTSEPQGAVKEILACLQK